MCKKQESKCKILNRKKRKKIKRPITKKQLKSKYKR